MPIGQLPTILQSVHIAAPGSLVYELITDVTRIGDWSPECRRCEWIGRAGPVPAPGDRFRGWNRQGLLRWSTLCEVEKADGREFAFRVVQGAAGRRTVWRFLVQAAEGSCRVTQICHPQPLRLS